MGDVHLVRGPDGAAADGTDWLFKATGHETEGQFDFMVGAVEYLSGPPLHVHREQYDTFYVLDGILAVQVEDQVVDLHPGDFASIPPGVPHTFDNIRGDQPPVRTINLMTPGGFKEFFDERARTGATSDLTVQAQVAAEHGITTVGPPLRVKLGLT